MTAAAMTGGPFPRLLEWGARDRGELVEAKNTAREEDPLERRALEAIAGGDSAAYDYLVTKYMKRVISVAWGILRNPDEAEDLAQEAFVKAFQSIGRFRRGEPFGPWIFRIVTNLALDVLKHRRRFRHEELHDNRPAERRDRADLPAISNEIATKIDRAIESLPEMQRIVARLFLVEEFSHTEIAAMMRLTEGTIRSHLSLARAKLREQLQELHGGRNDE